MKKIALSLTAASMIFAGLAGCGDVNDTGMNDTRTGYTTNQGAGTTGYGLTNDRTDLGNNGRTGLGFDNNRNQTNFFDGNRMTGRRGDGNTTGFGTNRGRGFGTRPGDGNFQIGGQSTQNRNVGHGAGFVNEERNFGSAFDYQSGNTTPEGFRGQNRGRNTGFNARGDANHRGFGRGITGNDRPGMVDENGILNRFDNNRGQQLGRQHQGFNRGTGTQGLNRGTGNRTQGFNQGTGTQGLNRGNGNQGMNHTPGTQGYEGALDNKGRDYANIYSNNTRERTRGLNRENGRTGMNGQNQTGAYFDSEDGRLATRINDRIAGDNIRDSRVIVNGNDVIVGVDADDTDGLDDNVRNRVGNLAGDRNVHVVTDRDQYNGLRDMDDRLRAGDAFDEVGATFNDMLNDLGNAVQRPFERSR